jgi:hypothetical protein
MSLSTRALSKEMCGWGVNVEHFCAIGRRNLDGSGLGGAGRSTRPRDRRTPRGARPSYFAAPVLADVLNGDNLVSQA